MFELSQLLAIVIFLAMFIAIITGKMGRYIPALIGAALTIILVFLVVMKSPQTALGIFNIAQLGQARFWIPGTEPLKSHGINWQTIIFIAGMMVMVESMAETGFFKWLCLWVAKTVNYRIIPVLMGFMLLAGFLSMFIDSITVLLFMATVGIELSRLLKFDPVPLIIGMIFAANTGGAASMSGDPPNIIIGTAFGYTFWDFLFNTGAIAWVGMLIAMVFFLFASRKSLKAAHNDTSELRHHQQLNGTITNRFLFMMNVAVFILVVVLLVTHAQTGLSVATIGVIAAILTLLITFKGTPEMVKRIDWRSLLFFLGLFVTVGGLEETGVLQTLAGYIGNVSKGDIVIVLTIILWTSAIASAVVDNIPFAATMVPVISNLSQTGGFSLPPLAWALSLGTDIGGNGTPIGASANVIGIAIAEREGHHIGWGRFLRYGLPAMLLVVTASWLLLMMRYA